MNFADLLLGRPLATEDEKAQRIGPAKGIPIFGLDALSSAAYGTKDWDALGGTDSLSCLVLGCQRTPEE